MKDKKEGWPMSGWPSVFLLDGGYACMDRYSHQCTLQKILRAHRDYPKYLSARHACRVLDRVVESADRLDQSVVDGAVQFIRGAAQYLFALGHGLRRSADYNAVGVLDYFGVALLNGSVFGGIGQGRRLEQSSDRAPDYLSHRAAGIVGGRNV